MKEKAWGKQNENEKRTKGKRRKEGEGNEGRRETK